MGFPDDKMPSSTALILGGGVGGVVTANELRQQLPPSHRVVLVEKNATHAFPPSFLWVMQICRPLATLLRRGIELVQSRTVRTSSAEIAYDRLVVALGADLAFDAVPGLARLAHVLQLRLCKEPARRPSRPSRRQDRRFGFRTAVQVPGRSPRTSHADCGPLSPARPFSQSGDPPLTPESQPMPVAGPLLGEAVRAMLQAKGIQFHAQHKSTSVEQEARELTFEDRERFRYDLVVAVPSHRAPKAVVEAGLAKAGWISVDPQTLATTQPGIYAIGDVTAIPIPGRWKSDVPLMLPKAGVFAHAQAEVVARRIAAEIVGRPCEATFCGNGYCMLEAGNKLAGFAFGNFFAEPAPSVQLRQMGKTWHIGKVLFEKWWLAPMGVRRSLLASTLRAGSRFYGIPIHL
jgi:sulfide:quinone oxidoreductase